MASFAVLPAAGRSTRMQSPKLLLPWGQSTVIEHVLAAWLSSAASRVIVTVHPDDRALAELCQRAGADVVVPSAAPADMKASVLAALDHVRRVYLPVASDVWLLAPADMPLLTRAVINQVLAAEQPADPRIVVPQHGGRSGHPVLFPWPLAERVGSLGADEGIDRLVQQHAQHVVAVDDPGIFCDLDTPADYRALVERHDR